MKSDWILIILSIIVGIVLTLIVVFSGIELNRRYKEKDCMKNKIEVGEYVRTKNGVIDKVDALYGMIENTEHLKSEYGYINNLIKHNYNKNTLSSIDKRNFVKKLCKAGLIEASDEIEIEVEKEKAEAKQIKEQIFLLEQRLRELEYD